MLLLGGIENNRPRTEITANEVFSERHRQGKYLDRNTTQKRNRTRGDAKPNVFSFVLMRKTERFGSVCGEPTERQINVCRFLTNTPWEDLLRNRNSPQQEIGKKFQQDLKLECMHATDAV